MAGDGENLIDFFDTVFERQAHPKRETRMRTGMTGSGWLAGLFPRPMAGAAEQVKLAAEGLGVTLLSFGDDPTKRGFAAPEFDPIGFGTRVLDARQFYERYPKWSVMETAEDRNHFPQRLQEHVFNWLARLP